VWALPLSGEAPSAPIHRSLDAASGAVTRVALPVADSPAVRGTGLAAGGTRFADARSASPWTLPSHWTMLTGRWPWEHGVVEDTRTLPESAAVLPQALADAGYATAAFTSTVYVSRAFGFQRGFQRLLQAGGGPQVGAGPAQAEQAGQQQGGSPVSGRFQMQAGGGGARIGE
jgi:arylsulfatase A-like enzyme